MKNGKCSKEETLQDEKNHSKNINSNSIVVPALKDQGTSESNKIPLSKDKQNQLIYNCILCPKTYRKRKSLIDHYKVHPGHCHDCGMPNLNTVEDIIQHNRTYHHKEFPFVCEICGESFSRRQQCTAHVDAHRKKDIKYFRCWECGIGYSDKRNYQQHVEETGHKQDSAICAVCGAGFNSKNALTQHVNQAHKKDNSFECHICQNKFTLKANLERHVQLHTEVKRTFECDKCGSSYFTHQALREHFSNAHTDVSESKCTLCGKIFSSVKSLQRHLPSHSEEKLHDCSLCSQTFKWKTHLVRHKQGVHGGSSSSSAKNMKRRSKELGSDGDASSVKSPRKSSKPKQKISSPPPPSSTTTKPQESPVFQYVTDSVTGHCPANTNSDANLLMNLNNYNPGADPNGYRYAQSLPLHSEQPIKYETPYQQEVTSQHPQGVQVTSAPPLPPRTLQQPQQFTCTPIADNNWHGYNTQNNAINQGMDNKDKYFSVVEMNSNEFIGLPMNVAGKQEPVLNNDLSIFQQNIWSPANHQINYNNGNAEQHHNYNSIGNILSNLELIGNNSPMNFNNYPMVNEQPGIQHNPYMHQDIDPNARNINHNLINYDYSSQNHTITDISNPMVQEQGQGQKNYQYHTPGSYEHPGRVYNQNDENKALLPPMTDYMHQQMQRPSDVNMMYYSPKDEDI